MVDNLGDISFKIFCGGTDLKGEELKSIEKNIWVKHSNNTDVFYSTKEKVYKNSKTQIEIIKPDALFIIGIFSWKYNIWLLLFS